MKFVFQSAVFTLMSVAMLLAQEAAETALYKVDVTKSTMEWVGRKVTGEHDGTIGIKSGTLEVKDSMLAGGAFEVDMTSIVNRDVEDPGYNQKLVDHLKSDDFFSVSTNPVASLEITHVSKTKEGMNIRGDLTIKGTTHAIEFPADVKIDGDLLTASAKITVDRAKYNVRFGSGSFFKGLGDKLIYDDFHLTVKLLAEKDKER